MRVARGNLHRTKAAWTPQTHGIQQYRRSKNAASSPFRQNRVSRLAATEGSPADRRDRPTACDTMQHAWSLRSARRNACSVGPVDSQAPIYPVTRVEVGFRCAVEGSPAARADNAAAWANIRRAKQLAPRAIDTTALGAADAGSGRWGTIVRPSAQARKTCSKRTPDLFFR